jgi:hypothetical protein
MKHSKVIHHCKMAINGRGFVPNGWSQCGGLYPKRTTVEIRNVTCLRCLKWFEKRFNMKGFTK